MSEFYFWNAAISVLPWFLAVYLASIARRYWHVLLGATVVVLLLVMAKPLFGLIFQEKLNGTILLSILFVLPLLKSKILIVFGIPIFAFMFFAYWLFERERV